MSNFVDPKIVPLPLPKDVRVESAKPRAKLWAKLPKREKQFTYHLLQAGLAGRDLLFFQSHRHALAIKSILLKAFSASGSKATKKLLGPAGYRELLVYTARFMDQGGPYGGSNRKFILKVITKDQWEKLVNRFGPALKKPVRAEIVRLLTDPTFEVRQYPENPDGEGLEHAGGNLYDKGITGAEVRAALDKTLHTQLNSRVVKGKKGVACRSLTVKSPGIVGKAVKKVSAQLKAARKFAATDYQKAEIDHLLKFFQTGVLEDFRQANIAWVKDRASSTVDFILGWVEVYEDWLSRIASWESYVQIVDPEVSRLAQKLASHAQYFENAMPYGKYKKTFPADYSPPAIMVYYFQEIASYRSGGYNLPNFDDIRRDVGAKNVIRLPLPGEDTDTLFKDMWKEALLAFAPQEKVDALLEAREKTWQVLVLLHEIIGHGSGIYDETKYKPGEDPISGLGSLGSALEEQRADLTALVFASDSRLIEVGLYKDAAEAEAHRKHMFDLYLVDFLKRTSRQRTFTEAHQRGHWLFIKKLLERKAIAWEKGVLAVKDYDLFHTVARDLLGELQQIKATRNETAMRELFAKYAPLEAIDEPWAQDIIRRGENLRINAGHVEQPWEITKALKFKAYGGGTLESIAPYWKEHY